jgi:phytoene dehydrogenase-like protein
MYRIVEALMELALRAGVEFEFDAPVERIEVGPNLASGVVREGGGFQKADAIVANADLPYIYSDLLPGSKTAARLAAAHPAPWSAFLKSIILRDPSRHPVLADDYRQRTSSTIWNAANPSLYIHAPARSASNPAGRDLIAIVPVGHLSANGEQDWVGIRNEARRQVFRRLATLGITDLESHIKFEVNFTPLSWRKRYNLTRGATHGLCHNLTHWAICDPTTVIPPTTTSTSSAPAHPGTACPLRWSPPALPPTASPTTSAYD